MYIQQHTRRPRKLSFSASSFALAAFSILFLSMMVALQTFGGHAVFAQSNGGSNNNNPGSITVVGVNLNGGAPVSGIRVDLRINGTDVQNGSIPVTFHNLQLGVQYGVVVYWYGNNYIRYINSSYFSTPDLQRYALITLNSSDPSVTLTSVFENVPPSEAASLNIIAEFPNGTKLGTASVVNGYDLHSPGVWLQVIPPGQTTPYTGTFTGGSILPFVFFNHETYTVEMSLDYNGPWITNLTDVGPNVNVTWSHWKDNNSPNATRAFTLNGNATYIAIYDQVPYVPQIKNTTTTTSTVPAFSTTTTSENGPASPQNPSGLPAPPPSETSTTNSMLQDFLGNNALLAVAAAIIILVAVAAAISVRHIHR